LRYKLSVFAVDTSCFFSAIQGYSSLNDFVSNLCQNPNRVVKLHMPTLVWDLGVVCQDKKGDSNQSKRR